VLAKMSFRPLLAGDLREMDAAIFSDAGLGLARRVAPAPAARIEYRAEDGLVVLTLDGLAIDAEDEAESIVEVLERRLGELGSGDSVVVDCDGFDPGSPGAVRLLQLLLDWDRSRSLAWYCTDPLQRRKLSRACMDAGTGGPIHPSFQRAAEALRSAPVTAIAD
jgi:hypothetical protein